MLVLLLVSLPCFLRELVFLEALHFLELLSSILSPYEIHMLLCYLVSALQLHVHKSKWSMQIRAFPLFPSPLDNEPLRNNGSNLLAVFYIEFLVFLVFLDQRFLSVSYCFSG